MKIHIAARNSQSEDQFKRNNPDAVNCVFHKNNISLFDLLQDIIDGKEDYVFFAHDDVFLPSCVNKNIKNLIDKLNSEWPKWGICSNAGIIAPEAADGSRICRFIFDPHAGNNLSGFIMPAESVDGNSILLNCRALRDAQVKLPKFNGFQGYDLSLSIETIGAGLAVLVAPQLACYHTSGGNLNQFNDACKSKNFLNYLATKIVNRSITTLNGTLELPFLFKNNGRFDLPRKALQNAIVGRAEASVAIVIRTQFRNINLLKRAILSALAFDASLETGRAQIYLVTDKPVSKDISDLESKVTIVSSSFETKTDTRNLLVEKAIECVSESHILFLDDDDFIFPNESSFILKILTCVPKTANLVVDSLLFDESSPSDGTDNLQNSFLKIKCRYYSSEWPLNLKGNNHVPMCGIFYSREILLEQPKDTYQNVDLFEDYTLSMYSILNQKSLFFSIPIIVSGICVREVNSSIPNTVNVNDRTKWSRSLSEVSFLLSNKMDGNILLGISKRANISNNNLPAIILSRDEKKVLAIIRVISVFFRLISRPKTFIVNVKFIAGNLKRLGLKTALVRLIYHNKQLF